MLKSKRLSVVVLAAFLFSVFTGLGTQKASAAASPTDIAGNWASAQITSLISQGVVSGYADGTYKPNNSISRAEYMTMINRAFNFTATSAINYSDVKTSDWFYTDICKAKAAGYIAGYADGTMKPNRNVTREEAAVILAGALKMDSSASGLSFTDAAKIQSWSKSAVSSVVAAGYMSGYPDGSFKPGNAISRAEAAAVVFAGQSRVQVTGVSLNKSTLKLGLDESETLIATVSPSDAANKNVMWVSSAPSVATVSNSGKVTGIDEGTATITVITSDSGKTAKCVVTVQDTVEVTGVSLNKSSLDLNDGDTYTLKATVTPSDATNKELTWTSDDKDVATVNSTGKVTAKGEGTCTIKATAKDGSGEYDTCDVTVGEDGSDLRLSNDSIDMESNDEITVKLYLPDGYDTSDVDDIEYDSDDPDVAEVTDYDDYSNDDYILFTISSYDEGSATITFDLEIDGDDYSIDCDVNVDDGNYGDDLSLDEDEIDIDEGESTEVDVYLPSGYTNEDIDSISYSVDDDDDVIDAVSYDRDYDDDDDYITYTIDAENNVDGSATVTFKIKIDGTWYTIDLDVNVND